MHGLRSTDAARLARGKLISEHLTRGGIMGGGTHREDGLIGRHLKMAHESSRGERQLADYVARLDLRECTRILEASPTSLASLAALREECRVEVGERRGFAEVIRTWTLHVLSGLEGG
jgi:hypothetical protein